MKYIENKMAHFFLKKTLKLYRLFGVHIIERKNYKIKIFLLLWRLQWVTNCMKLLPLNGTPIIHLYAIPNKPLWFASAYSRKSFACDYNFQIIPWYCKWIKLAQESQTTDRECFESETMFVHFFFSCAVFVSFCIRFLF